MPTAVLSRLAGLKAARLRSRLRLVAEHFPGREGDQVGDGAPGRGRADDQRGAPHAPTDVFLRSRPAGDGHQRAR